MVIEKLALIFLVKNVLNWTIEYFLNNVDLVLLLEHVLVNAPVLELQLQHFNVVFLFLVELSIVSYEINHHSKGSWVPVNKNLVVFSLNNMPTRKHCFERATLYMTEGVFANFKFLVATYVQLENVT